MVYMPAEDSILLSQEVENYLKDKSKDIKILDMGSGSGVQAETCRSLGFEDILCADLDPEAIKLLLKKKFKALESNLFSKLKKQKFDLIIFNPPYLPEDKYDKKIDTTGGKKGDETIIRFLRQAKSHLNPEGNILLLLSTFTPRKRINSILKEKKMKAEKLVEKTLFYESLEVWIISF